MKQSNTEEFIEKAKKRYGDLYDYSETVYKNSRTPVRIICKEHGVFEKTPHAHLMGQGCPVCGRMRQISKNRRSTAWFIERARNVHGNTYDYSHVIYENTRSVVEIVCEKHGSFFQRASSHLAGHRCPKCEKKSVRPSWVRKTTDEFIAEAKAVHGDLYDYSEVQYVTCKTPVTIVCAKHGKFKQTPSAHLSGKGCSRCAHERIAVQQRKSVDEFIHEARAVHGERYSYEEVVYENALKPVEIVCNVHGSFWQTPASHLSGRGCPTCAIEKTRKPWTAVIEDAGLIHEKQYEYLGRYIKDGRQYIRVICPEHGEFSQRLDTHLSGAHCPHCVKAQQRSFLESDVCAAVSTLVDTDNIVENDREIVSSGIEYDIVVPLKRIAIEVNGVYWHSELFHSPRDHEHKLRRAEQNGYQLITIWEDVWKSSRDACVLLLANKLHTLDARALAKLGIAPECTEKVPARRLQFRPIANTEANDFFAKNHIQGGSALSLSFGLFDDMGELRACCGICSPRHNARIRTQEGSWEIRRYATRGHVIGGFSKMVAHMERALGDDLKRWFSYSANDVSDGGMYERCGFTLDGTLSPDYMYVGKLTKMSRKAKQTFQKKTFRENPNLYYDDSMTEHELALANGLWRVYDSGKKRWVRDVARSA